MQLAKYYEYLAETYPLEVSAAPGDGYERLIGYFGAIRYVQALQPWAMLGNGSQSMVGHGIQARDVQCQQTVAPVDNGHNPVVGQFAAFVQGESLDPLATRERLHRPIADLALQTGEVQTLDESEIGEVAIFFAYCLDHIEEVFPTVAEWFVPEKIDGVS